jgi:hypothetical protein
MRAGFGSDERGVSTPRIALFAGGLALASLIGVRVLEAPLARQGHAAAAAAEARTDLEQLARTIPPAKGRIPGAAVPAAGQIDFTATANSSGKRTLQAACHGGERTVTMVAPAGGPPLVLSTCAAAKNWRD